MHARLFAAALTASIAASSIAAQNGDVEGEAQPALPEHLLVAPAPALSAADELATCAIAPGFRVELVAAEPLVRDPSNSPNLTPACPRAAGPCSCSRSAHPRDPGRALRSARLLGARD